MSSLIDKAINPKATSSISRKRKEKKPKKKKNFKLSREASQHLKMKIRNYVLLLKQPSSGKLLKKIPFNPAEMSSGIQVPTFRLYMDMVFLQATTSGPNVIIQTTRVAQAAEFNGFPDLAAIFDEYRPIRGSFEVHPVCFATTPTTNPPTILPVMLGVVDYDNGTALQTYSEGILYDTHKWIKIWGINDRQDLPINLDWIPDLQWLPVANDNVAFAYFKSYASNALLPGSLTDSHTYAFVAGWMDFQFRQTA